MIICEKKQNWSKFKLQLSHNLTWVCVVPFRMTNSKSRCQMLQIKILSIFLWVEYIENIVILTRFIFLYNLRTYTHLNAI